MAIVDLRLWQRDWYRRRLGAAGQPTADAWARTAQRPLYATSGAAAALPGGWVAESDLWHYKP